VGYGKPPEHTRFKKGQSGNRKGRAKGTPRLTSLEALLIRALNSPVVINENQGSRQVTKYETAIIQIVNNAASGKIQFAKLLLELVRFLAASSEHAPLTASAETRESARERVLRKLERMNAGIEARIRLAVSGVSVAKGGQTNTSTNS
jgi:hypothetical protein